MGIATIREAKPEDVAALHAINAAGQPGVAPLTAHEASAIAARATRCWVAEESGGVRGYLIAYTASDVYDGEEFAWFQQRFAAFLYIDQIAVSSESRHSGVGSQLYQVAGEYARAHGLSVLTCEVNVEPPNPISLRFHRALGFQEVGVLHTLDGRTVALVRLDVTTSPGAAATS